MLSSNCAPTIEITGTPQGNSFPVTLTLTNLGNTYSYVYVGLAVEDYTQSKGYTCYFPEINASPPEMFGIGTNNSASWSGILITTPYSIDSAPGDLMEAQINLYNFYTNTVVASSSYNYRYSHHSDPLPNPEPNPGPLPTDNPPIVYPSIPPAGPVGPGC